MSEQHKTRDGITRLAPLIVITLLAVFIALHYNIDQLKDLILKYEKPGYVIAFLMYIIPGFTVIPSEPITLLILAWKGPWLALVFATAGNTLSAIAEYYIGGTLGNIADFEAQKAKLPFNLGRLPVSSPIFLLFARMLPGFMPKLISIAGGMYKVPVFTFLWTTFLSNFIGAGMVILASLGIFSLFKI